MGSTAAPAVFDAPSRRTFEMMQAVRVNVPTRANGEGAVGCARGGRAPPKASPR